MSIYDRLQAVASANLLKYGGPVTLLQTGPSVYDPTQGKNTTTTVTYKGTGALFDYSLTQPAVSTIRGTEIQQGDKILYLSLQGTDASGKPVVMPAPDTDDTVVVNGVSYSVLTRTTIDPSGGSPVVHSAHVRGVTK